MGFWVHMAAAKHPERAALVGSGGEVSYRELSRWAVETAGAIQALGASGGDEVALAIDDRVEFAVALQACLLLGAPAVPVDLRLVEDERAVRAARARVVLEEAPRAPHPMVRSEPSLDAVATVMHTSGTTSAPKRVELTYCNWLANAFGSAVALGLDPDERWLCTMPLTHVGGLSVLIRSVIYATTVVLHERFDTESVLAALMSAEQRITLVSLVPTMLTRLLDAGLTHPPALRWALVGGGPIPGGLLERAADAGVPVAPTYGMTEACSQIATFGLPLHGVEMRIASDGEVLVRGSVVAPGALSADGWLHTGDLGAFDEGRLRITGRKADTIVTGGENVTPAEVEEVLLAHPAVADAAVHGKPDPEWGEAVIATVVVREGARVAPPELREHCARRLASFKVPKDFRFTERLPRSETGKLLRGELR
jgi:O-succinylbenzoic acid--CoA ligase